MITLVNRLVTELETTEKAGPNVVPFELIDILSRNDTFEIGKFRLMVAKEGLDFSFERENSLVTDQIVLKVKESESRAEKIYYALTFAAKTNRVVAKQVKDLLSKLVSA